MPNTLDFELARAFRAAAAPVPRTRAAWCEAELVIPDGPYKGERFRWDRQPFAKLLVAELDAERWPEVFICGPSQSGKTLIGHVAMVAYVAAELRRNLVVGVPDAKMVADKWNVDFRPVFAASPTLRRLLPRVGPGSGGGTVKDYVQLTNGAMLRFMTAGGDDTARAAFTAEGGVYVTEAARWSKPGQASVEADPLEQLRARMQSTPRRDRRLIVEGTSTIDAELPWAAWDQSTQSRILTPCPHCRGWVALEREHLVGWREATSELAAAEMAWWACPACGQEITSDQRRAANAAALLVHRGQTVTARGKVTGDLPPTERLWFRWSMFHNQLLEAADIAPDEWKGAKLEPDSDQHHASEKKLSQFVWAIPWSPPDLTVDALQPGDLAERASLLPRGELPADTQWLTVGADCGMYLVHWVAIAWRGNRTAHVVDYETITVLKKEEGDTAVERREAVEVKLFSALELLRERCAIGWAAGTGRRTPDRMLVDAGWLTDTVHDWAKRVGSPVFAALGRGTGQRAGHAYAHPAKKTNVVRNLGDGYHVRRSSKWQCWYFVADADQWKSAVHRALRVAAGEPGALTLFRDTQTNHRTFDRHLTAEVLQVEVHPRHGRLERWHNPGGKPNHYFDATMLAAVGGHHAGFRLVVDADDGPPAAAGGGAVAKKQTWWK